MAPQDSQNCGRDFAKRKQTDADFAANSMVIIDIESNTSVGGLTLGPAGMHCPSWDDAFVSSYDYDYCVLSFTVQCLLHAVCRRLQCFDNVGWTGGHLAYEEQCWIVNVTGVTGLYCCSLVVITIISNK